MQTLLHWTLLLIAIYSLQTLFTDLFATSLIFNEGYTYCVIFSLSVFYYLYNKAVLTRPFESRKRCSGRHDSCD